MKHIALFIIAIAGIFSSLNAQTPSDSILIVNHKWITDTVSEGVIMHIGHFDSLYHEPQNIVMIEIDNNVTKLGIGVNNPVETTSESAKTLNALAAVNGSFFDMQKGNSVCFLNKDGKIIDYSTKKNMNYNGAVMIRNGQARLLPWEVANESELTDSIMSYDTLVSGPMLITDGNYCEIPAREKSFSTTHHPRTGMYIKEDGIVVLVTVDGRQPGFAGGMSLPCFAHLLKIMGAQQALNLDGGGSTTAWVSGRSDGVVNRPSGGRQRKVANIIYAF